MNLRTAQSLCIKVMQATNAADAGVVVSASIRVDEITYTIWAMGTDGKITSHKLDASCTDEARLTAHTIGFIENHLKAWGRQ